MGRFIVKLTTSDLREFYLEWSTIVDAPITAGMTLDDFKQYYRDQYGTDEMCHLDLRLQRVEFFGTSAISAERPEEMIVGNRAGPDESPLSMDEIIRAYCLKEPIRGGWSPFDKSE